MAMGGKTLVATNRHSASHTRSRTHTHGVPVRRLAHHERDVVTCTPPSTQLHPIRWQVKQRPYALHRVSRRRGRECQHTPRPHDVVEHVLQPQVRRAEVVRPQRYAVGLVDAHLRSGSVAVSASTSSQQSAASQQARARTSDTGGSSPLLSKRWKERVNNRSGDTNSKRTEESLIPCPHQPSTSAHRTTRSTAQGQGLPTSTTRCCSWAGWPE